MERSRENFFGYNETKLEDKEKEPPLQILEIGPGHDPSYLHFPHDVAGHEYRFVGVDFDMYALKELQERDSKRYVPKVLIQSKVGGWARDAKGVGYENRLPVQNKSMDVAVLRNVLSVGLEISRTDPMPVIQEVSRSLKDGGQVVILETNTPTLDDFAFCNRANLKLMRMLMPALIYHNEEERIKRELKIALQNKSNQHSTLAKNFYRDIPALYDYIVKSFIRIDPCGHSQQELRQKEHQFWVNTIHKEKSSLYKWMLEGSMTPLSSLESSAIYTQKKVINHGSEIISHPNQTFQHFCLPYMAIYEK